MPARTRWLDARVHSIPELCEKPHARARSIPKHFDARPSLLYPDKSAPIINTLIIKVSIFFCF